MQGLNFADLPSAARGNASGGNASGGNASASGGNAPRPSCFRTRLKAALTSPPIEPLHATKGLFRQLA